MNSVRHSPLLFVVIAAFAGLLSASLLLSPTVALARSLLNQPVLTQHGMWPREASEGDHEAMHAACMRGDWEAMEREMDRVHPDWRSHHGSGSNHMGMGGDMMGGSMMPGNMMDPSGEMMGDHRMMGNSMGMGSMMGRR